MLVELADFAEQARLDHQGRAGHVIRVAHIAEAWILGVLVTAPIPSVAEAPHDPAAFLQPAVREQQFRAGDPDFWVAPQRLIQLIEPARLHLGVVVEKHDIRAARRFESTVARADETLIGGVPHDADGAAEHKICEQRLVARAIVDNDDLVWNFGAVLLDRPDALIGQVELVVDRDDDRDDRVLGVIEVKRVIPLD